VRATDFLNDSLVYWFVRQNTNRAMQTRDDHEDAGLLLDKHGLPRHRDDRVKDWDQLLALYHAMRLTRQFDNILDAGANCPSDFLQGMSLLMRHSLTGIGLGIHDRQMPHADYLNGDITATPFDNSTRTFVACISVIEHGVDLRAFFKEMGRIIRPGGHLFVSFDYWMDPIDTGGRMAFGAPVKVFDVEDIALMLRLAEHSGLEITGPFDVACRDRVVHWIDGLEDYTFANMLFRKV